jgi:hypothetical protein
MTRLGDQRQVGRATAIDHGREVVLGHAGMHFHFAGVLVVFGSLPWRQSPSLGIVIADFGQIAEEPCLIAWQVEQTSE